MMYFNPLISFPVLITPIVMHENLVKKWEERAKKYGGDTSKWIYGDRLYEEEFGKRKIK